MICETVMVLLEVLVMVSVYVVLPLPCTCVGDALFAGSMGKAISPAAELAKQKIRDQIFTLPAEALICPGHGPVTTVGEEKANNPFFE